MRGFFYAAFPGKVETFEGWKSSGSSCSTFRLLPLASTFCFSSSFIFLTVASWLVMPVVSVVVAGGLALGTEVCAGDVVAGCRSGWRIRLGGHLLNVPKQDARNQRRERRHFCVHHALLSENRNVQTRLKFQVACRSAASECASRSLRRWR